jgi:tRNA_anti-like
MISVLRGLFMPDDSLPPADKAVLAFFEIVAFALGWAGVDRLLAGTSLFIVIPIFAATILTSYTGFKWPRIKQQLSKKPRRQAPPETSASLPLVVHPENTAQGEKREIVDVTPEYLIGFYRQGHTSVQARKLAEAFLGKWIKVSGPVGDILGAYDNQRMVVFSDRSIYEHDFVNMFFRDNTRFGQLSTLKPGDMITVIGQVQDVNQLEIWLNNCELVDS